MNTKVLMIASALAMGLAGILFTFLPNEILSYAGLVSKDLNVLFLQILGALYFAFAILNWMARANVIGGIYSKPIAMGNFTHFFIAGITIFKNAFANESIIASWVGAIIYLIFAVMFATVVFRHPLTTD